MPGTSDAAARYEVRIRSSRSAVPLLESKCELSVGSRTYGVAPRLALDDRTWVHDGTIGQARRETVLQTPLANDLLHCRARSGGLHKMAGNSPDEDQRTVEEIMNEADPAHAPTASLLVNYRW